MNTHRHLDLALVLACVLLTGCGPSAEERAEQRRIECLNNYCQDDVLPKYDTSRESAFKVNGRWFVGPREYVGYGGRTGFEWWNHKPLSRTEPRPPEAQALALAGKSGDFTIDILIRGSITPTAPSGYQLIELAMRENRIFERKTIRPGLDAIRMKHLVGAESDPADIFTYYAATGLKGMDGFPPVASCDHSREDRFGGAGFMWKSGVWVSVRMNQRHCVDWPEIYTEIIRILQLIREV